MNFFKLILPAILIIVGVSSIICSLPGQGKNLSNALDLVLTFASAAWMSSLQKNVNSSFEPPETQGDKAQEFWGR